VNSPVEVGSRLSIGEVLGRLRADFPDITISKIRFLEAEGLIEPERSPSGYRRFSPADVERLSYVLRAQRDQYLPLRVIKERLDAHDRGAPAPSEPAGGPRIEAMLAAADAQTPVAQDFVPEPADVRLTREELVRTAGVDPDQLAELETYGLVTRRDRDGHYDADALHIATTVARLGSYGLEPRHLRLFKTAADRHLGLIEQVIAPLRPGRGAGAGEGRVEEATREIAALAVRLHAALLRRGLAPR
jgi:DNA-binding transcriptional MerR regulator